MFFAKGALISGRARRDQPAMFRWQDREHRVEHVSLHWRVHTNWWKEHEDWRDYWEVATDTGLLVILYHDLIDNVWRLERVYE